MTPVGQDISTSETVAKLLASGLLSVASQGGGRGGAGGSDFSEIAGGGEKAGGDTTWADRHVGEGEMGGGDERGTGEGGGGGGGGVKEMKVVLKSVEIAGVSAAFHQALGDCYWQVHGVVCVCVCV
jgi:hypothetical protein